MSSLDKDQLSNVFTPPLDREVIAGNPAFSIPYETWQANYPAGYHWWFEVFKRAADAGLSIKKVEFDDRGRAGFQFFRSSEGVGSDASDWVAWAERKRKSS